MKKIFIPACFIAIISLSACSEQVSEYDNSLPSVQPNTSAVIADSMQAAGPTVNQQLAPSVTEQPAVPTSTAALNPQHGQPGHRCDIAVGAPLNSPPQQIQQTIPANPVLSNPVTNTGGSVTLNPPHGQPGHDCAIPVGQPLRS